MTSREMVQDSATRNQRSNTVGISKTQNADRTAHTEHIE